MFVFPLPGFFIQSAYREENANTPHKVRHIVWRNFYLRLLLLIFIYFTKFCCFFYCWCSHDYLWRIREIWILSCHLGPRPIRNLLLLRRYTCFHCKVANVLCLARLAHPVLVAKRRFLLQESDWSKHALCSTKSILGFITHLLIAVTGSFCILTFCPSMKFGAMMVSWLLKCLQQWRLHSTAIWKTWHSKLIDMSQSTGGILYIAVVEIVVVAPNLKCLSVDMWLKICKNLPSGLPILPE